jgi:hypothetical protein
MFVNQVKHFLIGNRLFLKPIGIIYYNDSTMGRVIVLAPKTLSTSQKLAIVGGILVLLGDFFALLSLLTDESGED